jgi:excisionase family DNA binding protein
VDSNATLGTDANRTMSSHEAAPMPPATPDQPRSGTFTVTEIVARLQVDRRTVLAWIRAGELRAINVVRAPGGQPRYRVTPEELADFEERRQEQPSPTRARPRRPGRVREFF